ncbi:MAG: choline ABC transporter permease [Desulfitibacter sp. BRH_c19]|nr:MAG: choline ABC transporter permease [Desulfitibacter sp. BRH_c19]
MTALCDYMIRRQDAIIELVIDHAGLVFLAVLVAIVLGITLGLFCSYNEKLANVILPFTQIMMTVPSIALMALLLPILGIGFRNALVALIVYSLLPIVRNTYVGIKNIEPDILEAAKGMGMTEISILSRIKVPMSLPVIIAGIRTAVVMVVGIGAIASYIGARGLGELIFRGISRTNPQMIITGAILIAILAIVADYGLGWLEKRMIKRQS